MLRKLSIIVFALSVFAVFTQTEANAQTRVSFKKGASNGKVSGRLKPNEHRKFILSAFEGQEIRVKVASSGDRVKVEGEYGPTENYFDAKDGNNVIRIYNSSDVPTNFTATFTIKDIVNAREKQVMFAKGKSSRTYNSTIGGNLIRVFVLNAREGQVITAKISSKNKDVIINEEEGATWLQMDAKAGANRFEIINKSNVRSPYTLTFTIKDKKLPPPTRINFAKGKSSKTLDLEMFKYKKSKRFVVRANKDQAVIISIETPNAVERIAMDASNAKDNVDEWLDGFGSLRIKTGRSGDYIFEVIKLDEKYLKAKMKVSILDSSEF